MAQPNKRGQCNAIARRTANKYERKQSYCLYSLGLRMIKCSNLLADWIMTRPPALCRSSQGPPRSRLSIPAMLLGLELSESARWNCRRRLVSRERGRLGFNLAVTALHFGRPAGTRRADSLHAMGLLADNGRSRMVGYEATKSWDGYDKELDLRKTSDRLYVSLVVARCFCFLIFRSPPTFPSFWSYSDSVTCLASVSYLWASNAITKYL